MGAPAWAQATASVDSAGGGTIDIEAGGGIEWRRDELSYIAMGGVLVTRGGVSIQAGSITARYRDRDAGASIYRLEAAGGVRLSRGDETVFADQAVYDLEQDVIVFSGGELRIETPKQTVSASESLEYWTKRRVLVARGGARAVDGKRQVEADQLTAYFKKGSDGVVALYQVEATGHVRLTGKDTVAEGAKAIYNLDAGVATLSGKVRISVGRAQLNGERAEVNLRTGISRLTGTGTSRVRTLFIPRQEPAIKVQ